MTERFRKNVARTVSAPFQVWFFTVASSLGLLIISIVTFPPITSATFNAGRLQDFVRSSKERSSPSVVVIGSSLTERAFYKDETMEKMAVKRGRPMHFLRFTLNAGVLPDYYDLLDSVLEAGPDLVCMESTLFTVNFRGQSFSRYVFDRHRSYVRKCIKRIIQHLPLVGDRLYLPVEFGAGNYVDPPFGKPKRQSQLREEYRKGARMMKIRSFTDGERYAVLFRKARRLGVRICLLDLPRSGAAWEILPASFQQSCRRLIARYERTYGLVYQPCTVSLHGDDFTDMAHLSPRGRALYSSWFVEQLPEILGSN